MPMTIVPLKCPTCGGVLEPPQPNAPFGSEVTCSYCAATSLLIIDRNLVTRASLEASGGRICMSCGRVARGEARFCQCGASLIRTCYWCYDEVPVDHARCDICGWLDPGAGVTPGIEGRWTTFLALLEFRVADMARDDDRDHLEQYMALFKSVWKDQAAGAVYHQRYAEILMALKYDWPVPTPEKNKTHYNFHGLVLLIDAMFEKVGEPMLDYLVQMSVEPNSRAVAVVVLLFRLHEVKHYNRSTACPKAARRALAAIMARKDADLNVRGWAAYFLGVGQCLDELVALARGQDPETAELSMTALERHASGGTVPIGTLTTCANRDIALRARAVVKRIEKGR